MQNFYKHFFCAFALLVITSADVMACPDGYSGWPICVPNAPKPRVPPPRFDPLPLPRPQSWGELLPVCWGRPQECRDDARAPRRNDIPPSPAPSVSVTRRYMCSDATSGQARAYCEIKHSAANCESVQGYFRERFKRKDPCQQCTDGVIDRTLVANGTVEEIGPCTGRTSFSSP
jgi:hypothetical protein